MKHNSYVKARFFERLIAEIEQSVEQMEDNDLERIIFMCWSAQQSRREDAPSGAKDISQENGLKVGLMEG